MQVLNILDDLLQTCGNGEAAAIRTATEEQIKISNPVIITGGEITLGHGQLVKITEHGQIQFLVDNHFKSPRSLFALIILHFMKYSKLFH
jgi:hypothetical protein